MGFVGLSGCFVFLSCSGLNAELVNFPSYRIEIIAVQLLFLKIAITESPIFIGPQAFNNLLMISASFEGEELEFFIVCEVQKCLYKLLNPALTALFPVQGAGQCLISTAMALSLPGNPVVSPVSCGKGVKCAG